jgi:hypothetical protein
MTDARQLREVGNDSVEVRRRGRARYENGNNLDIIVRVEHDLAFAHRIAGGLQSLVQQIAHFGRAPRIRGDADLVGGVIPK